MPRPAPKPSPDLTAAIRVRLTPEQRRQLERAAALDERTLSDWCRRVLVATARLRPRGAR